MVRNVAGFDWDHGNWPKCGKDGVTREEIQHVLTSAPLVRPDRRLQEVEVRCNAVGRTATGRHVFVVFTIREKDGLNLIRPISARYMHAREVQSYDRQTGDQA